MIWGIELGLNLSTALLGIITVLILSLTGMDSIRRMIPLLNAINKSQVGVALLLSVAVLGFVAPSGPLGDLGDLGISTGEEVNYYSSTDLTVYAKDASTGASVNGQVELFDSSSNVNDIAKATGTADSLGSRTLTSGSATFNGFDTTVEPAPLVHVDNTSYYNFIETENVQVSTDLQDNALDETFYPVDIGTIDTSKTSASLTISAGSSGQTTIYYVNSESDSEIRNPVVKFSNTRNMSLESVDNGGTLETVSGTKYVVFDGGPVQGNDVVTAKVTLSLASGSADGAFDWVYDDMWQAYGDDAIQTDGDVNSASSSTQSVTVTP